MAITQVSNSLVKQDLTISGGTVDNTVIGSGTPAAGTFTTVAGTLASTVTGTTAAASDNSTKIATTAYVTTALANLVDSAPGTLNTLNELAAALGDDASFSTTVTTSIAAKLPLAGGTMTGDLILGDNVKIEIGSASGGDLEIYHDGSNSYINEQGTGALFIRSSYVAIAGANANQMLNAEQGAAIELYYNNAKKLETTSTGISVTGNVNVGNVVETERGSASAPPYTFKDDLDTGMFNISNANLGFSVSGVERMRIDSSGNTHFGKSAFSVSTDGATITGNGAGTFTSTQSSANQESVLFLNRKSTDGDIIKLYKDSSVVGSISTAGGDLLIRSTATNHSGLRFGEGYIFPTDNSGATSDAVMDLGISAVARFKDLYITGLDVTASTYNKINSYFSGSYISGFKFSDLNGGIWYDAGTDDLTVSAGHANSQLILVSGGSEAMRLDSSGNVGIGTSSAGTFRTKIKHSAASVTTGLGIEASANDSVLRVFHSGSLAGFNATYSSTGAYVPMVFNVGSGGEAMRIDTGGNVGIGVAPTFTPGGSRRLLQVTNGSSGGQIALSNDSNEAENPRIFADADNLGFATATTGGGVMQFYTAGSERMRIDSDGVAHFNGDVKVLSGDIQMGSGRGINFTASSNTSGMTSETLDDYEEGEWTPVFESSTTTVNDATYTKIGRVVHIQLYINFTAAASSSQAQINGLPFPTATDTGQNNYSVCSIGFVGGANMSLLANAIFAHNGGSYIYFHRIDGNANPVTKSTFNSNGCTTLIMSGSYITNS